MDEYELKWFLVQAAAWCYSPTGAVHPLLSSLSEHVDTASMPTILNGILEGIGWAEENVPAVAEPGYRIRKQTVVGLSQVVPWQTQLARAIMDIDGLSHIVEPDGEDFTLLPRQSDRFRKEMSHLARILCRNGALTG